MLNLELLAVKEQSRNGMSVYLKPQTPVVITPTLVEDIRVLQDSLAEKYLSNTYEDYFYIVWYLDKCNFLSCRGLDFNYLTGCLKQHKESEMEHYIDRIFNLVFLNYIGLGLPVINCSIITRPLTGFSKDFFLLNQICFICNKEIKKLTPVDLNDLAPFSFNQEMYERNHYFYYKSLQLSKMKALIEKMHHQVFNSEEIERIKGEFEVLKAQTLARIYEIASRDMKILERKANTDLVCWPSAA